MSSNDLPDCREEMEEELSVEPQMPRQNPIETRSRNVLMQRHTVSAFYTITMSRYKIGLHST